MKNKILFICRNYGDPKSACGICIKNLVDEFRRRDFEVWVISVTKTPLAEYMDSKDIHYFTVKEVWFTTFSREARTKKGFVNRLLYKAIYYLRLPYAICEFPVSSNRLIKELTSLIGELVSNNGIYYVVGSYSPFEPIKALIEIKRKFGKEIKTVCYHLDPLLLQDNTSKIINNFKFKRSLAAATEEASVVDLILAQQSTKDLLTRPNIEYVDFPLFVNEDTIHDSGVVFSKDYTNITYIGTLDEENRNPEYFLDILRYISNKTRKPCKLHIWGFIRESRTIEKLKSNSFVEYHGMMDSNQVLDVLLKSDVLLNISNKLSYKAIPSKIFQLFSTKKPIINIVRHPRDFAKQYFDIYPSVFTINEFFRNVDNSQLISFIDENQGKTVSFSDSLYKTSTPQYISDLIIQ